MVTTIRKGAQPHLYIKEWIEFRDLSDERVADRIGVSRETVFRWYKEQHRLNPGKIAALANALDVEPEQLWHPPGLPSLDALLKHASKELRETATDIVKRLIGKAA